jgi:hypothetical protein
MPTFMSSAMISPSFQAWKYPLPTIQLCFDLSVVAFIHHPPPSLSIARRSHPQLLWGHTGSNSMLKSMLCSSLRDQPKVDWLQTSPRDYWFCILLNILCTYLYLYSYCLNIEHQYRCFADRDALGTWHNFWNPFNKVDFLENSWESKRNDLLWFFFCFSEYKQSYTSNWLTVDFVLYLACW